MAMSDEKLIGVFRIEISVKVEPPTPGGPEPVKKPKKTKKFPRRGTSPATGRPSRLSIPFSSKTEREKYNHCKWLCQKWKAPWPEAQEYEAAEQLQLAEECQQKANITPPKEPENHEPEIPPAPTTTPLKVGDKVKQIKKMPGSAVFYGVCRVADFKPGGLIKVEDSSKNFFWVEKACVELVEQ